MLHHIEIYVSDIKRSKLFWSGLLGRIGYQVTGDWGEGFTLSQREDGAYLTFVQVNEEHGARPYHRCGVGLNHLAFRVENRQAVIELLDYCTASSISTLYDERFPHANGGTDYFALFIEDPDRIKVEFVAA